uniref:NADH-ubiquinone oxidoreductase chain 6 n=1 Tax=Cheirotonus gestroi TaxID=1207173 RepID=A0A6H0EYI5_9SCAR|nr:NADH dehydrogenase subunit 6 [Cheirotonus gestroi]QIT06609.1 NADH dehydrogenase subunit 6 [Cheirotonus gestroi]
MLKMLMITTLMNSMMILITKHPLSMGLILLIQTLTVTLTAGFFSHNYWFSYILFLVLIGGMLVLFIYMTSVASNEKFVYSPKTKIVMIISATMSIPILMINPLFANLNTMTSETFNNPKTFELSLNKFINMPSNMILYLLIIYLLVTLIAIVKITSMKTGPLRQYN